MLSPASRIVSAISFGVFWRARAFDERDHAVEERFAGVGRDPHLQPVGDDLRAAGDAAADVRARLLQHRRRLARDRGLVDVGHALDHFAVAGDDLVLAHEDDVALAQLVRGDHLLAAVAQAARGRVLLRCAQRVGLRLAARFGHRLREVREEDGEPEPDRDLQREADVVATEEVAQKPERRQRASHFNDEHHRVARHPARVQLRERVASSAAHQRPRPNALARAPARRQVLHLVGLRRPHSRRLQAAGRAPRRAPATRSSACCWSLLSAHLILRRSSRRCP